MSRASLRTDILEAQQYRLNGPNSLPTAGNCYALQRELVCPVDFMPFYGSAFDRHGPPSG